MFSLLNRPKPPPPSSSFPFFLMIIFGVIMVSGIGGYFYYYLKKRKEEQEKENQLLLELKQQQLNQQSQQNNQQNNQHNNQQNQEEGQEHHEEQYYTQDNCEFSEWSDWGECDQECGPGRQTRTRTLISGEDTCGPLSQTKTCEIKKCPVDCKMSEWTEWTNCSVPCGGGGVKERTRTVEQYPRYGGQQCGAEKEVQACGDFECPVDCELSPWSSWSDCRYYHYYCDPVSSEYPKNLNGQKGRRRLLLQRPNSTGKSCTSKYGASDPSVSCQQTEFGVCLMELHPCSYNGKCFMPNSSGDHWKAIMGNLPIPGY